MELSYLLLNSTDPAYNLAVEQYVFESLPRDRMYFMLWQNNNAIIVGKHQNTYAEINSEFVEKQNIKVVRRLSGGGAVYHDLGNLNFTFISDSIGECIDFPTFCKPIAKAIKKLGVPVEINGRNDMLIDGRKFSGNSQYIRNGRVMHHGTILFNSDLSVIGNALRVDPDKIIAKGIKSVRSRVTNVADHLPIDIGIASFKEALLTSILEERSGSSYELTPEDLLAIENIKATRYDTWAWNFGHSPECTMRKKARIDGCGSIEVHISVKQGGIASMQVFGDFFSMKDPAMLCNALAGIPLTCAACKSALESLDVSQYILGLSNDEFVRILNQ